MRRQGLPRTMVSRESSVCATGQGKRITGMLLLRLSVILVLSLFTLSALVALGFGSFSSRSTCNPLSPSSSEAKHEGIYMDGLLPRRVEGDSCRSRSQHHLYRKASRFRPSDYLIVKLREYEKLHQKCAPHAESFLKSSSSSGNKDCKFVVWVSYSGLGNKLVTLTATFLYALLTNRVLLVTRSKDTEHLLCEPFPGASWLLPPGFPPDLVKSLNESHPNRFANLFDVKNCIPDAGHLKKNQKQATGAADFYYIHLTHTYNVRDRRFFCEGEQAFLADIQWLFLRSNNYFVPSLYFLPSFRTEMQRMFPQLESVFHHLGRYLLHPAEDVWDRTVRFYESYLSGADRVVGLQLRTFESSDSAVKSFSDQVVRCVISDQRILPVTNNRTSPPGGRTGSRVSVIVASLKRVYGERLRDLYVENANEGQVSVRISQASAEEVQKSESEEHEKKAMMEMWLLSMSEEIVTSPMSTFGYVARGLAGVRGVLLSRKQGGGQESCVVVRSMEPCFHAPPLYDCDCAGGRDPGKVLDSVRHCQDVEWGIQLVDS